MEVQETPYMGACCFVEGSPLQCLPKQENASSYQVEVVHVSMLQRFKSLQGYSPHDIHPDVPLTILKGFKGFPN